MEQNDFGKNLATLRKSKNLTQTELAQQLHFTFQSVSNWERGISSPDIETILRLAEFFNVSTDELLGNAEAKPYAESENIARDKKRSQKRSERRVEYYETLSACSLAFKIILYVYAAVSGISLILIAPLALTSAFAALLLLPSLLLMLFCSVTIYILLPFAKQFKEYTVAPKIFIATIPITVLLAVAVAFIKSPTALLVLTVINNIITYVFWIFAWLAFADKEEKSKIRKTYATALFLLFAFQFVGFFFESFFIDFILSFLTFVLLFSLEFGKNPRMKSTFHTTYRPVIQPIIGKEQELSAHSAEIPASFRAQAFKSANATPAAYTPPNTEFTERLRRKSEFEEMRLFNSQILPFINVISVFIAFTLVLSFFSLAKAIVYSIILLANAVFFFLAKQGAKKLAVDIAALTLFLAKIVTDAIFLSGISLSDVSPSYDMPLWIAFASMSVGVMFSLYVSFAFSNKTKSWKSIILNVLSTVFVLATTIFITCICYDIRYTYADNVLELSPAIFFQNLSIIVSLFILCFSKDDRVILRKKQA